MSKYADFVKDFEKWEDEEMNAAETAYYIEVQSRVSKKLLEEWPTKYTFTHKTIPTHFRAGIVL